VGLRLDSTVLTADQHLHNFFGHSERLLEGGKTGAVPAETETCKILKAAHAIDMKSLINYLPTVLNELFTLLVHTQSGFNYASGVVCQFACSACQEAKWRSPRKRPEPVRTMENAFPRAHSQKWLSGRVH